MIKYKRPSGSIIEAADTPKIAPKEITKDGSGE
jgi:hypothetical protein